MAGIKPTDSVLIQHIKPDEAISIVRELRSHGLVQGIDFDFRYRPPTWEIDNGVTPSGAEFYFYKEKWRTFFAIKYAC